MYGVNLLILIYSFHLHSLSKHEAHIKDICSDIKSRNLKQQKFLIPPFGFKQICIILVKKYK